MTVILTVYNRLTFFADALRSVEAQTFEDYEIVVADDSGNGAAREASLASNNPRIRYRANPSSLGIALSLRAALAEARGKYIAILNDDDLWEREFLARLVPPLEADSRSGVWRSAITRSSTRTAESTEQLPSETPNGSDGRGLSEGDIADPKEFVLRQNGVPLAMGRYFGRRRFRPIVSSAMWPAHTTSGSHR